MSTTKSANANAKNAKQGTTKTSPAKSSKKSKLTGKNLEIAKNQAKMEKTLKYIYPKDKMSKEEKKTFRRTARAARRKFENSISALKKSNEKSAKKDLLKTQQQFDSWKKNTLTVA